MDGGLERSLVRGGKGSLSRTKTVLPPLDLHKQHEINRNRTMMATSAMTAMNHTLLCHSSEAVRGADVAGTTSAENTERLRVKC